MTNKIEPTAKPGWCHDLFLGSVDDLLERVKTIIDEAAKAKKGK